MTYNWETVAATLCLVSFIGMNEMQSAFIIHPVNETGWLLNDV